MQFNRQTWMIQNRLWFRTVATITALTALLLFVVIKYGPDIASHWLQKTSPNQITLAEAESRLTTETHRTDCLRLTLDSLSLITDALSSDQAILAAIKECCRTQSVTLTSYDRIQIGSQSSNQGVSYRLLIEGSFRAVALLVADLESLPAGLMVQSLAVEHKIGSTDKLNGVLLIRSGAE